MDTSRTTKCQWFRDSSKDKNGLRDKNQIEDLIFVIGSPMNIDISINVEHPMSKHRMRLTTIGEMIDQDLTNTVHRFVRLII